MSSLVKLVLIIADLHCGHVFGLTHPDFDARPDCDPGQAGYKRYQLRRRFWKWFIETVQSLGHIDVLIANGDLIDGKGSKSGGRELLTADRTEQTDQAVAIIDLINADANFITFGTPYHTGIDEDWEREVAQKIKHCEGLGEHLFVTVNGVKFDCRHFASSSSVPYGRATPIDKERVQAVMSESVGQYPQDVDVIVRSHTHWYEKTQNEYGTQLSTPCLQLSSQHGRSVKSGPISVGTLAFHITGEDKWSDEWLRYRLRSLVPEYKVQ